MAAKASWHRYGTKLRHCRPMYLNTDEWRCRGRCSKSAMLHRFAQFAVNYNICSISGGPEKKRDLTAAFNDPNVSSAQNN